MRRAFLQKLPTAITNESIKMGVGLGCIGHGYRYTLYYLSSRWSTFFLSIIKKRRNEIKWTNREIWNESGRIYRIRMLEVSMSRFLSSSQVWLPLRLANFPRVRPYPRLINLRDVASYSESEKNRQINNTYRYMYIRNYRTKQPNLLGRYLVPNLKVIRGTDGKFIALLAV